MPISNNNVFTKCEDQFGTNPTFSAIACPAGDLTKSRKAWASAVGLSGA
jgi:hypothetical protein